MGLEPRKGGETPGFAYALVKITYDVFRGRAMAGQPEPLLSDIFATEEQEGRLAPGSDFWLSKGATDVVIRGSAQAPHGRPVPEMQVLARVGRTVKKIAVFGRREITWGRDGRMRIGEPEPFTEIPLHYGNAYGGMDPRVPIPETEREQYMFFASQGKAVDHPGLYPRNPGGKAYLVYPEPIIGLEMPNLEDPDDLLTPQRLVVGAPELWYKQPLPWCYEWTNMLMYPRELYGGFDAWFPSREPAALPEVRRGFLPLQATRPPPFATPPSSEFFQEASLGMVVRESLTGQTITISGMQPDEPALTFTVPGEPHIEIDIEGHRSVPPPLRTSVLIRPAEKKFSVVWCAKTSSLPRAFIPEVHKNIPLQVRVNGDAPIRYQSPLTIRDRLAAAQSPGTGGNLPPTAGP